MPGKTRDRTSVLGGSVGAAGGASSGLAFELPPAFAIFAFVPALVRGSRWVFEKAEPLDVKRLGWAEMKQGVAFGVLLAVAFSYW